MNNTAFFIFLCVLVLGIIYVLKTSEDPPETGITQTPKEYIQYIEQRKEEKRNAE